MAPRPARQGLPLLQKGSWVRVSAAADASCCGGTWHACILTECPQDVGRGVSHISLAKSSHKLLADSRIAICSCPAFQKLGSNSLVVSADERVGVVDRCAVHREPRHCSSAPAAI